MKTPLDAPLRNLGRPTVKRLPSQETEPSGSALVPFRGVLLNRRSHSVRSAKREHARLGAELEKRDLQHPLPNRVVLAQDLVQAAVPE